MSHTHHIFCGDCVKLPFADDAFDLTFCSPPYGKARKYGKLAFPHKGRAWVDWAVPRFVEALRVTKGPVCWVVGGSTNNYAWDALPALLIARLMDLQDQGKLFLRNPPIFHRMGIPGSGGPDWWRSDYETIVCATRNRGKLPWSDNTATGAPPKFAPGGRPTHRTKDDTRVHIRQPSGAIETQGYKPPKLANPGNVIRCKVGGGHMGNILAHKNEAPFPESLADHFVKSFCPIGGIVLDIFNGSGSTQASAMRLGRHSVGIDIRLSQCVIARERLGDPARMIELLDDYVCDTEQMPDHVLVPFQPEWSQGLPLAA
jgi:hypothetical protein